MTWASNTLTESMINIIETHSQSSLSDRQPWFAWVAYQNPHWPLEAPAEYIDIYREATGPGADGRARAYVLALIKNMDDSVGAIMEV